MSFLPTRWYALCQRHLEKIEKVGRHRADPITDTERCEWNLDHATRRCAEEARWEVWVPGEGAA